MKRLLIVCFTTFFAGCIFAQKALTVAEASGYTRTSSYRDVMDFLRTVSLGSQRIRLGFLGLSAQERSIPLVVISGEGIASPREMAAAGKSAIFINANIHGGEVEGKEACQMLIRDAADGGLDDWLTQLVILVCPIFNPDGNDRFGKNRHDNGPELAGMRANAQGLDLNRDFLKLETPEVSALLRVLNEWDPVLFVDIHTTNGSYHREPVTYATMSHPDTDPGLREFMWHTFFPAVAERLKQTYHVDSVPYGNFVDRFQPEKGWSNRALDARFGFNYLGLRNRLTILNENYSHADFRTRVIGSYSFLRAILETTHRKIETMIQLVRRADVATRNGFRSAGSAVEYGVEWLMDIRLKSYTFQKIPIPQEERSRYPSWYGNFMVVPSEPLREYTLPYLAKPKAKRLVDLPLAYIILPPRPDLARLLLAHGLTVQRVESDIRTEAQTYSIDSLVLADRIYQGRVMLDVKVHTLKEDVLIPAGSIYLSMRQPLARLIPVLMEPESPDSLLRWGFFNRDIAPQWTSVPGPYPVVRILKPPANIHLTVQRH